MVVRSAGVASATVISRKLLKMKLEMSLSGGSCIYDMLKVMKLDVRGTKSVKTGEVRIEVSPSVYERVTVEDKVNKILLKKLEDMNGEDPRCITRALSALSKLIVLSTVPAQVGGAVGGLVQRGLLYNKGDLVTSSLATAGKILEEDQGKEPMDKALDTSAVSARVSLAKFLGKNYVEEQKLKQELACRASVLLELVKSINATPAKGGSVGGEDPMEGGEVPSD